MAHRLEARDLVGAVASMPVSVRLAPPVDAVADLIHDESRLSAAGVASVAEPGNVDELRRVLAWHAAHEHAVTVSGARTGLTGGAVPAPDTHLVSVARLRGVLEVRLTTDPPTVRALAGTTLRELQSTLAARAPGYALPLDPTEASASLGGMVATNAAGARAFRYGATRDWVVGLTVELASGRTLEVRRGRDVADGAALTLVDGDVRSVELAAIPKPATKNSIGYGFVPGGDVVDLFVGSEGTLGVVSDVTLRLMPVTASRLALLQCFATPAQAFDLVDRARRDDSLDTTALEFLDRRSHELARDTGKPEVTRVLASVPAGSCSIFAECGYEDDAGLERTVERLLAHVTAAGGDHAAGLAGLDEQSLADIRAFRHAVPERINAIIAERRAEHPTLHKIATDMAVADADLAWVFNLYSTRLSAEGLDHAIFGHVGNNHFHVNILPRNDVELVRAKAIYADFARAIVARGGVVSAEHGIGRIKKAFLTVQYGHAVIDTLRRAKRWLDPAWRLNPGVLIDP